MCVHVLYIFIYIYICVCVRLCMCLYIYIYYRVQQKAIEKLDQKEQGSGSTTSDKKQSASSQDEMEAEEAKKIVQTLTEANAAAKDEESTKEIVKSAARSVGSLSDTEFNISFNPDVFQNHVQHADPQVVITLVVLYFGFI